MEEGKRGLFLNEGRGDEPQWIVQKEDCRNVKEGGSREKKQTGEQSMFRKVGQFVKNFLAAEKEQFENTKRRRRKGVKKDQHFDVCHEEHVCGSVAAEEV